MIMRALSAKGKLTVVSALLMAALIFIITGPMMENSVHGTWSSLCEIEGTLTPRDIIQIGDNMFFADGGEAIRVSRSYDGCNWFEIESPASDHDIWLCSIALFRASGDNLGIVWEETDPELFKKPCSLFFWSIFDGSTWSDPESLFPRDECCTLRDAMMLEDGSLLLLWEERLVQYFKEGDRTIRGSGCDVVYRAFIGEDEIFIERVIEPEDPSFCSADGYSFIDDGERIWCVFEYGLYTHSFYRSWSQDGRQWSVPEPFTISGPPAREALLTSQGEFGILCYRIIEEDLILFKSADWETWSGEKIFKAGKDISRAVITGGSNTMWGVVDTENGMFIIQPSQVLKQEY